MIKKSFEHRMMDLLIQLQEKKISHKNAEQQNKIIGHIIRHAALKMLRGDSYEIEKESKKSIS